MLSEDSLLKLRFLASASEIVVKQALIRSASEAFVRLLLSILLSVVVGKLKLSEDEHRQLRRYASLLTRLASPTGDIGEKRRILRQRRSVQVLAQLLTFVLPQLTDGDNEWNSLHFNPLPEDDYPRESL
jgi:hypothetical protein